MLTVVTLRVVACLGSLSLFPAVPLTGEGVSRGARRRGAAFESNEAIRVETGQQLPLKAPEEPLAFFPHSLGEHM